jgi:uncharacterized membrane protein HdeD (DUF308 family)
MFTNISVVIAQALGIFLIVGGIAMVVNTKETATAIEESVQNKGVLWTWGFLSLLIGAVIVVLNNVWTTGLPLFVTILGWLALIKGVFIVIFPGVAASFYRKLNKSSILALCGIVVFVIGLVLLYW